MNASEINLSRPGFQSLFGEYSALLDLRIEGERQYGWGGKSVGARTTSGTWLKLTFRSNSAINERVWTGEESASVLNVPKPRLLRSLRWMDQNIVWRLDECSLATGNIVSATADLSATIDLTDGWWDEMRSAIDTLEEIETKRVLVRQDLVSRRVAEISDGMVDPSVHEWATAHGDLHWKNLCAPELTILDWEGWGRAPRGLDAATLWAFSLNASDVKARIEDVFADHFSTRTGRLSQLFMCAELLRMNSKYGDYPTLVGPLRDSSRRLVDLLA